MQMKPSHPQNAPGDFYVEDGCCTSCHLPFQEAPGLFQCDDVGHCYVCKQPSTSKEVDEMVRAVWVSEVSCIRYAGRDQRILSKLIALNERSQCDVLTGERDVSAPPKRGWWAFWPW